MLSLEQGLSYDDVLAIPQRSPVETRQNVSLQTTLGTDITLDLPVMSAPMDTVTGIDIATTLGKHGGMGVIHRFVEIAQQAMMVESVTSEDVPVGAAIGVEEDYVERADAVIDAGVDMLVVDVAHGHLEKTLNAVKTLSESFPSITLAAGNVATQEGVRDLVDAGADVVKVGVGPGSHCTTREVAGVGVPQFTAVVNAVEEAERLTSDVSIIADGGITSSGDAVKALLAGADVVMMGSFFMGTEESPGEFKKTPDGERVKVTRGMASEEANEERSDKDVKPTVEEGVVQQTPYKGSAGVLLDEFAAGVRSGVSYSGGRDIQEAREKVEFMQVTNATQGRNGKHNGHNRS